ncbi:MAG TPA: His/Gly/Thr/Pro-type tRNA ligase C-terminal domain-containing protein, partial [Saprospiraceae bacterium]|nr:His/Gly/Thr/Pro-type tRNA ligase C-terminal domain-containing protein [Saprospiraceae bacterium]
MIHRAPFGSMERFTAVLIEHCAGKFPLWLTPEQFAVLPVSDKYVEYAFQVKQALEAEDLRGVVDDRNETIGRKIRDNELKRIPFLLIVGEKEQEAGTVAVRKQGEGDQGALSISGFADQVKAML